MEEFYSYIETKSTKNDKAEKNNTAIDNLNTICEIDPYGTNCA